MSRTDWISFFDHIGDDFLDVFLDVVPRHERQLDDVERQKTLWWEELIFVAASFADRLNDSLAVVDRVKHARQQIVFILPAMGNTENKGWKSLRKKFFIIFLEGEQTYRRNQLLDKLKKFCKVMM